MVLRGDEIWMYYVGMSHEHTPSNEARARNTLGRVVLRKDGFTCVEADYQGGEFTTPLLRFQGEALMLNIETSALGLARVEIQDENRTPLEGYAMKDCDRIHTRHCTSHVVTWRNGNSDLGKLSGQPVRLWRSSTGRTSLLSALTSLPAGQFLTRRGPKEGKS